VNGSEIGTFTPDAREASTATFELEAGRHPLKRGFNRLAFSKPAGTPPVAVYRIGVK
jgi:hypothetical protein